ncbi:MAG: glycoside hydrolase family 2 protein [Pseudomonadota bacterium]
MEDVVLTLSDGWSLLQTAPAEIHDPAQLPSATGAWLDAIVPGTVAQSWQAAGRWDFETRVDFDAHDWWYRCTFKRAHQAHAKPLVLSFDGLATVAEVWLNGRSILRSHNMFLRHEIAVTDLLAEENELVICFRAMNQALEQKRPRPRWKTNLVSHQQLRWWRTTLLGRMPGWSPPVAPVGPWRAIRLCAQPVLTEIALHPRLEGRHGVVECSARIAGGFAEDTTAILYAAGQQVALRLDRDGDTLRLRGRLEIDAPDLWWPHTHGDPALYACRIEITHAGARQSIDCGRIGFRSVRADVSAGGFGLIVNERPVFCCGAVWTVNDIVSLSGDEASLEQALRLARAAGANMLRLSGTMIYERERFYALCDELGILVWQDFMFANMDYPAEDAGFRATVTDEIMQQLRRWQPHPCIAVYCGGSEVEQQAAMLGMPRELWRNALFAEIIPALCRAHHPDVPYVPSSPSGGVLPFHVDHGVGHYYGVGAYMRPIEDVRRARVRFASECLGFSNMPEPETIDLVMNGRNAVLHDPKWKSRVPRDHGSAWDFEDVRDHYLQRVFGADPVALRCFDMPRYLELSRVVTGEVMSQVFAEWRTRSRDCRGGLVWFYQDLWPGAGWGVIDSTRWPKACYYYLRRAWAPRAVFFTDESVNSLHVHLVNDADVAVEGRLELRMLRGGEAVVAQGVLPCRVAAHDVRTLVSDELLQGFYDANYAYRFGPPKHEVVVATWLGADDVVLGEACFFPQPRVPTPLAGQPLRVEVTRSADDYYLRLSSQAFLQGVRFDINGYLPDDNYFHLTPGRDKTVTFRRFGAGERKFKGYVEALNLREPVKFAGAD